MKMHLEMSSAKRRLFVLTYDGICVSEADHHYMHQCWRIVNGAFGKHIENVAYE